MQQFVGEVSGLLSDVEEDEVRQRRLIEEPATQVYSHIDAATGRPYYFDATRQMIVWQQPPVDGIEQWSNSSTAAVADVQPSKLSQERLSVERLLSDSARLIDRLTVAVEGVSEARRVSAALLRLELRIRRDDWQAGAVSEEHTIRRLTELLSRTEKELSASGESQAADPPLPPTQPLDSASEEAEGSVEAAASQQIRTSDTASHPSIERADAVTEGTAAHTAVITSNVAVSTAPPPGVKRRAGVVSRPPSNTASAQSPPPASLSPPFDQPTAALPSITPPPSVQSVVSGSKRRLEDTKGAVGAMVQRWKAVRREAEDEGSRVQQERQRQQEQRMRDAEAEVRSSGGAASNPNLIAVSGDWRNRIRDKQSYSSKCVGGVSASLAGNIDAMQFSIPTLHLSSFRLGVLRAVM